MSTLDKFLTYITEQVNLRETQGKYDAYFDVPLTLDFNCHEQSLIVEHVRSLRTQNGDRIGARLYAPRCIQTFWTLSPKQHEHFENMKFFL